MMPKKWQFFDNSGIVATAMTYTMLKDFEVQDEAGEGYMAVGTSEYDLIILRIDKTGKCEVLSIIERAHENVITSVLALTDHISTLSFATLSLDSQIRIFNRDGELDYESIANG